MNSALGNAQGKLDRLASSAIGAGKSLSIGLTAPLGAAAVGLVKLASDAEENISKFNAVFGESQKQVSEWAKGFAGDIGRSVLDVKQQLAGFQDTFVPLGFAAEHAEGLSKELVGLTADLGSFHNMADSDVQQRLTSALIGNHEAVQQFGIVLTAATVQQEAFAQTGKTVASELTLQEKVQARLSLITKGAGQAVGDAARTAGGFANQLKALQGVSKDAAAELGMILLPAAKSLVVAARNAVTWFQGLSTETKTLIVAVGGAAAALGPLLIAFGGTIKAIGLIKVGAGGLVKVLGILGKAFTITKIKAIAAWAAAAAPIAGVVLAIGGIVTALGFFGKEIGYWVGKVAGLVVDSFIARLNLIIDGLNLIIKGVNAVAGTTIEQFDKMGYVSDKFAAAGERMGEDVSDAIKGIASEISGAVSGFLGFGETVASETPDIVDEMDSITTAVGGSTEAIRKMDAAFGELQPRVIETGDLMEAQAPKVAAIELEAIKLPAAFESARDTSALVTEAMSLQWDQWRENVGGVIGGFNEHIQGVFGGLGELLPGPLGNMLSQVANWANSAIGLFNSVMDTIRSISSAISSVSSALSSVGSIASSVGSAASSVGSAVSSALGIGGGGAAAAGGASAAGTAGAGAAGTAGAGGGGAAGTGALAAAAVPAAAFAAFTAASLGAVNLLGGDVGGALSPLLGGGNRDTGSTSSGINLKDTAAWAETAGGSPFYRPPRLQTGDELLRQGVDLDKIAERGVSAPTINLRVELDGQEVGKVITDKLDRGGRGRT